MNLATIGKLADELDYDGELHENAEWEENVFLALLTLKEATAKLDAAENLREAIVHIRAAERHARDRSKVLSS